MIQAIGYMIGAYIITNMVHLLIDKRLRRSVFTAVLAAITILVALLAILELAIGGSEIASKLRF